MGTAIDGRAARGARSRGAIVDRARRLAAVDGLEGVSLARLAQELAMSKSGVAALFGSKEALQLATIAAAREVFVDEVVRPSLAVQGGVDRVRALVEAHLRYSERRLESGGCFFSSTSSEFAARPSPVREAIVSARRAWDETVTLVVARAIERGELPATTDAAQLSFALRALLEAANSDALQFSSAEPYRRARTAVESLLETGGQPRALSAAERPPRGSAPPSS